MRTRDFGRCLMVLIICTMRLRANCLKDIYIYIYIVYIYNIYIYIYHPFLPSVYPPSFLFVWVSFSGHQVAVACLAPRNPGKFLGVWFKFCLVQGGLRPAFCLQEVDYRSAEDWEDFQYIAPPPPPLDSLADLSTSGGRCPFRV